MSVSSQLALKIMELLEGNADVEDVRAVQQVIEMHLDDLKAEAVGAPNDKMAIFADMRQRAGEALFEGKGAVPVTKGEFILAWSENLITGHMTKNGCVFTFMGMPIKRKGLDG